MVQSASWDITHKHKWKHNHAFTISVLTSYPQIDTAIVDPQKRWRILRTGHPLLLKLWLSPILTAFVKNIASSHRELVSLTDWLHQILHTYAHCKLFAIHSFAKHFSTSVVFIKKIQEKGMNWCQIMLF